MPKWMGYIFLALVSLSGPQAFAQTTQPAPDLWSQTAQAVAGGMIHSDADAILTSLLPGDAKLREFGATRTEPRRRLIERAAGSQIVATRVYSWSANTVATDLAADVKVCEFIPPSMRAPFIPRDDAEAKKANAIAQQWIASVIDPAPGDLVAVIMLWEPPVSATSLLISSEPPEPKQPLFVFIKGKQATDGSVQISLVAFGDAKQALK